MRWVWDILSSSIGKKVQVALAGLLLCGFLISHLAGNMLMWAGKDTFNSYALALEKNILLPAAEVALAVLFLVHVAVALRVRYENRRARPIAYQQRASAGGRTPGSATMLWTGLLVLVFVAVHVKTMRLTDHAGDLYGFVLNKFQNVPYASFYLAAMAALGLHLSHGFQAAFRTFGVDNPRYSGVISRLGVAFAGAIAAGFAAIVVWAGWLQGPAGGAAP